jgi:flagellar biosynthesis protein FlhG
MRTSGPTVNSATLPASAGAPLSIAEVSRATGLEESLLRFYESECGQELPEKILCGDTLLFAPGAVEAFRQIHARGGVGQAGKDRPGGAPFARVIAVTSGKGGVGKSNIALNLAIELQRLGRMTVLLDADLGMANLHLLAGLSPCYGIADLLRGRRIAEILLPGPEGVGILPGSGGVVALADSSAQDRRLILEALRGVEEKSDFLLVDTGAGMGAGVRDFLLAADETLFVLTPDITSLADAYGLLKTLARDEKFRQRPIHAVVNMADSLRQAADTALRFSGCARQFLGLTVRNAGYVLRDSAVAAALVRRTPLCVFQPDARASRNLKNIAVAMAREEAAGARLTSAFARFMNMLQSETSEGRSAAGGLGS